LVTQLGQEKGLQWGVPLEKKMEAMMATVKGEK